ncbi:hypothetical protein ACSVDA_02740 [Cytobacillus sp. Hm23]
MLVEGDLNICTFSYNPKERGEGDVIENILLVVCTRLYESVKHFYTHVEQQVICLS